MGEHTRCYSTAVDSKASFRDLWGVKSKGEKSKSRLPPAREQFGEALRRARKELRYSQEELAELAGLHRTYVGQIERFEKNISIDNMQKLADAVKVPLWQLLQP